MSPNGTILQNQDSPSFPGHTVIRDRCHCPLLCPKTESHTLSALSPNSTSSRTSAPNQCQKTTPPSQQTSQAPIPKQGALAHLHPTLQLSNSLKPHERLPTPVAVEPHHRERSAENHPRPLSVANPKPYPKPLTLPRKVHGLPNYPSPSLAIAQSGSESHPPRDEV